MLQTLGLPFGASNRSNFETPVAGDRTLAQLAGGIGDRCGPGAGDVDCQAPAV
jgi:hypothetical protein